MNGNAGTCARSQARPLTICWWRKQLCSPWFAARRRSQLSSGGNTTLHPYFSISDNVPERTENNCLHIKQVRTDRTRSRKSPSSIHGWINPIEVLAFDCSWFMFLYVNLNHASLFAWLWFPIQVDVDAALVEAERVGHACSRQFPSCSVSRIDILRFVNNLGWSGGRKVNLFQCFAGFTRIRRTPFAACLCLMGCRQIRCKDRESNSWCHIIPTTATIPSHCFLNVASIY